MLASIWRDDRCVVRFENQYYAYATCGSDGAGHSISSELSGVLHRAPSVRQAQPLDPSPQLNSRPARVAHVNINAQQKPHGKRSATATTALFFYFSIFALHFSLFASERATEAAPPLVLGSPKVVKLDWGTRALQVADVNGDGLNDILVVNNDRATIEILYQLKPGEPLPRVPASLTANRWEPVLEDASFRKATISTGVTMFDLATGDLNGDGRVDLAYTSPTQNLTIRYQQADGSWTESKITDAPTPNPLVGSIKIADLDGDKRADLAMLGSKELDVFYQQSDGTLAAPQRYMLPEENCYGLEICDVDGDGRPDLVYLCASGQRQTMRVRLQTSARQFGPELSYEIKASRCTLQVLQQAKRDPKTGEFQPARFAIAQEGTGQLEEFSLNLDTAPDVDSRNAPALALHPRVFSPRPGAKIPGASAFGHFSTCGTPAPASSVTATTGTVASLALPPSFFLPRIPAQSATVGAGAGSSLEGADVVVSDPEGAQVFLYARQPDGGFATAQKSPVFSDARFLATGDWFGDGHDVLFVGSPKEQAIGVSRYLDGRFEYPQPLPIPGKPLAIAYGDFDGHGHRYLAVVREDKGRRFLELWKSKIGSSKAGDAECARSIELTGLKTDPRAIRLVDANHDGLLDIALFTPLDAMRLYVQGPGLAFAEASATAGFRRGLVDNLEYSALTLGILDSNGGGQPAMIVSGNGYARALKLGTSGLEVIDQFNASDPGADIATAFALPGPGAMGGAPANGATSVSGVTAHSDSKPSVNSSSKLKLDASLSRSTRSTVVLYDRKNEQFQILRPNDKGIYEISDTAPAGKIDVTNAEVITTPEGVATEVFIFGRDRFWWLPLNQPDFKITTLSTHATDLPDISYADLIAGDFGGGAGKPDIVCVDPVKNLIEILRRDSAGGWESVMHFKVFETDQHFQGKRGSAYEPRETVLADVTGNGRKSLILLVHDRVLVYPSQ